ncbi:MAG: 50S ribosomal protein L32 [Candidatus Abyssobacteria bacterium SURF_17]|uniref:Large ribosomal subunit protein bL32 n=1 Tax=Candidatus Abyssobacteria bacterium SURF_17 TaxID=2093361 RepID=A0A419ET34_9BACT|nr:MAG: 50S ribosomal protein L32 [Candidatus Abyssubacteria bacterium SURF_17]
MALPKRRISRTRRDKRRAHRALRAPNTIKCPNCAKPMLSHRVCPECGFYKGRQVVMTPES